MQTSNLQMTPAEILTEYRQAKDPKAQIGILADENLCEKWEIVQILREQGEKIQGYNKRPPKPEKPAAEQEETVSLRDTLPLLLRTAAVDAIAKLLHKSEQEQKEGRDPALVTERFREQTRGLLFLVSEMEERWNAPEEDG